MAEVLNEYMPPEGSGAAASMACLVRSRLVGNRQNVEVLPKVLDGPALPHAP